MTNEFTSFDREMIMQRVQMAMSEKRFLHVLGVEKTAIELAKRFGGHIEQAALAGLTHDYAKERPDEEFELVIYRDGYDLNLLKYGNAIWHGLIGADFVERELKITDQAVLQAVRLHTTGAAQMTLLDKILYVADYIEPGRDFPGVEEARKLAEVDLDAAVAFETKHTLAHLLENEQLIYPKTLETYNQWVVKPKQFKA
ncbi:bis(5'-nucleosyl)-tetraphosphatase (symmetrical) YqeK [Enterococcus sp. HY326]|uniref:bis(5'-nucleosyl)-tetraphosphatase (symmetrical) YqeK n=1 Tax=Enterococcus sp. HY326 TaxID=2971265 RepID=UPI00223FD8E8|nr:bis(5'-nucleosyl)-tetraphosphatase (symmetrical) YqeK [Enterococcus sp. HY326]